MISLYFISIDTREFICNKIKTLKIISIYKKYACEVKDIHGNIICCPPQSTNGENNYEN
jgi:hypothetical protein